MLLLALGADLAHAQAVDRFPRPEFDSGYELPQPTTPAPRARVLEYVDLAVLTAALALASYLGLGARSRRGLLLLSIFSLLYFGFWRQGCVCPVGSIQNVTQAWFDRQYAVSAVVLAFFTLPLVFTLFFGRTFCASVCPLGVIQDLVVWRPVAVPRPLASLLGLLPHAFLGLTVLLAATGVGFLTCRLDPFVGFFRLGASPAMLWFGALLLLLGLFVGRPYCRFLCPYGVLLGWLSRFSRWHVRITPTECVQCRLCEDACPFGAILEPAVQGPAEPRGRGIRRLALALAVLPVCVVAGGWAGSRFETILARQAVRPRIAERLLLEQAGAVSGTTLETDSFMSTGETAEYIVAESVALRRRLARGGWLVGGFVGLVFCVRFLGLSVHRTRKDYEPDRAACVSCARCFIHCPKERERLKAAAAADVGAKTA